MLAVWDCPPAWRQEEAGRGRAQVVVVELIRQLSAPLAPRPGCRVPAAVGAHRRRARGAVRRLRHAADLRGGGYWLGSRLVGGEVRRHDGGIGRRRCSGRGAGRTRHGGGAGGGHPRRAHGRAGARGGVSGGRFARVVAAPAAGRRHGGGGAHRGELRVPHQPGVADAGGGRRGGRAAGARAGGHRLQCAVLHPAGAGRAAAGAAPRPTARGVVVRGAGGETVAAAVRGRRRAPGPALPPAAARARDGGQRRTQ